MPYYKNANHMAYSAIDTEVISNGVCISETFQLFVISIPYKGSFSISSMAQTSLKLTDSLASASQGLGLKSCTTTPGPLISFQI